ncbi:MAG TPA: hypothetical protein VJI68_00090 [Candidatus Nanoarchaeia archaeon]|nr:hypothetical protein [Candidatus Nanoarchaeia archaeon]
MNKKASMEFLAEKLVDLVMLVIVIVVFLSVITSIKGNEVHDLNVESRDLAFVKDAITMTNHKIDYNYKTRENVEIEINENDCVIKTSNKQGEASPKSFYCINNQLSNKEKINLKVKNE